MSGKQLVRTGLAAALALLFLAGLTLAQEPASTPLGTGFTYQGQLKRDGVPYSGTCDLMFDLWDSASDDGSPLGTQTMSGLNLTDGYFTVQLDYGAGAFTGDARWLAVSVCCPAGSCTYEALAPREPLTAAPYALYSRAAPWSGLSGVPAGFADGIDNNTTYSAGDGLIFTSTTTLALDTDYTNKKYVNEGQANSVTAAMIVDGAGSGLDADLLDGSHASAFSAAGHGHWGASWSCCSGSSGSETGLTLSGGATGVWGEGWGAGVRGESDYNEGIGVMGRATSSWGFTRGVSGRSDSVEGIGVAGVATASSGYTTGVFGRSDSTEGVGVRGLANTSSGTTAGVLGEAGTGVSWGVAGYNSFSGAGLGAWSTGGDLIQALSGDFPGGSLRFRVDQAGNVHYAGSLVHFVPVAGPAGSEAGQVSLYGLASTEVWFEDLGSANLVEGRAEVTIDPVFAQTVALTGSYQVYLTAICQEPVLLHVSEKTPAGFMVQGVRLDGGPSSCGFDYRLAARRLGYQDLRLEAVEVEGESRP